jgi:glycosyltransferase involved in cell wall biosynthesis
MKITIIAFNFGPTKLFTNGPGIALFNFCKSLKDIQFDVFSQIKPEELPKNCIAYPISNLSYLIKSASESDAVHYWSGITPAAIRAGEIASRVSDKVILGPNLIDCVELDKEKYLLKRIKPYRILSVNDRVKYQIAFNHDIHSKMIETFLVGPDLELWKPSAKREDFILWKGNSRQPVKDVNFALNLKQKLKKYNIITLGYPKPYRYNEHINLAKRASLYIGTSISETQSHTLMESWASGVPSVTHPKIYLHGINYQTGIITNKAIEDYADAISEIMENHKLRQAISDGAYSYAKENFSSQSLLKKYLGILES